MKKTMNLLKTNLHYVVLFLIYVITIIFFARLNSIFGEATGVSLSMIILFPILIFGIALTMPKIKEALKISDKTSTLVALISIGVLLAISVVFIIINPHNFIAYLLPAALLPIAIYILLKNVLCKCVYKNIGSITLAVILAVSFGFIGIVSPSTLAEGTEIIEKSGYTDVKYVLPMGENLYTTINADYEKLGFDSYDSGMGFYIFNGKKNDKEYAIYIEVTSGKIAIIQNFAEHEKAVILNSYTPDAE